MYFDNGELKVGLMTKRSQGQSKVLTAVNYKERVFVLTSKELKYFDGSVERRGKEKGNIDLSKVKVIEKVDEEALDKPYCFQIAHEDLTLYIIANSDEERKDWLDALQDECRNNQFLLKQYHSGIHWNNSWTCCDASNKNDTGCKESFKTREQRQDDRKKKTPSILGMPLPPIPVEITNGVPGNRGPLPAVPSMNEQHRLPPQIPLPYPPDQHKEEAPKEVGKAIYDFQGAEPGDLSFKKGAIFTILSKPGEHWWLARNEAGEEGYIPSNYVRPEGMESESWFFKNISRQETESVLKKEGREGTFVIRNSSKGDNMYTLSVLHNDIVKHYHIKQDEENKYHISDRHRFDTIPELVNYHQHNSGGLITRLRHPPKDENAPVTAGLGHDLIIIQKSELQLGRELGAGQFGSVKAGKWRGTKDVAVKMMKTGSMSEDEFICEAKIMQKFQHPHLVQFLGVCETEPIFLVTELMSKGCLLDYLRNHQDELLSHKRSLLAAWTQHVASAMTYLEKEGFIHRDLAARNCLINENDVVKVADFGLARFVIDDEYTASEGTKFPIKWAAPEVINFSKFSSKSDVWAFGIFVWELYTGGKQPYPGVSNPQVVEKIKNGYRLPKPKECPSEFYRIMKACWENEPENRPRFESILKKITDLLGDDYADTFENDETA